MRFLADESCDFNVVRALREAEFDVLAVVEVIPRATDARVIELAVVEDRVLLTEDKDFGQLVFMLIDVGLLAQQPTDKLVDFEHVYDFAEVFKAGAGYRWPGVSTSGE